MCLFKTVDCEKNKNSKGREVFWNPYHNFEKIKQQEAKERSKIGRGYVGQKSTLVLHAKTNMALLI